MRHDFTPMFDGSVDELDFCPAGPEVKVGKQRIAGIELVESAVADGC